VGGKLIRKPYLRAVAILFILGGCTFPTRVEVAPPSSALRAQIVAVQPLHLQFSLHLEGGV